MVAAVNWEMEMSCRPPIANGNVNRLFFNKLIKKSCIELMLIHSTSLNSKIAFAFCSCQNITLISLIRF